MKKINVIVLICLAVFTISCNKQDEYLIAKNQIGLLSSETKAEEIQSILSKDVVEVDESSEQPATLVDKDEVYQISNKEGKALLKVVTSIDKQDSIAKIKYVDILSNDYKTQKGVSLQSKYKEINKNYTINKVEVTLSTVILYIDELNLTITLDKKDLGIDAFDLNPVSKEQISESAKIKSMTLWMN